MKIEYEKIEFFIHIKKAMVIGTPYMSKYLKAPHRPKSRARSKKGLHTPQKLRFVPLEQKRPKKCEPVTPDRRIPRSPLRSPPKIRRPVYDGPIFPVGNISADFICRDCFNCM